MEYELVQPAPVVESVGAIAVVMVMGPLTHHGDWFGGDTYDAIEDRVKAALATSADVVVIKFDSPGGEVDGAFECSRTLRRMAAASGKRLIAYVDECATSAAYALACAAEAVYMPRSGRAGSIGVISMVVDATGADTQEGLKFTVLTSGARKSDGNPHVPITDEAKGHIQAEVDGFARMFFELVAESRGLSVDEVAAQQAAIFRGEDAVAAKLVDGVTNWEDLLALLSSGNVDSPAAPSAASGEPAKETAMTNAELLAALKALMAEEAPAPEAPEKKEEGDMSKAELLSAVKAMFAEDDDTSVPPPPHKEPDGDEGPAPAKPSDGDEDNAKKAKAASADPVMQALAMAHAAKAEVASMKAQMQEREDSIERAKLLDARPDLDSKARALLASKPLAYVREALEFIPRTIPSPAAAANTPAVIRGEGQGERVSDNADLDIRMGITKPKATIQRNGYEMTFQAMSPAEARAHLAALEAKGAK
jgi:ClpP class serine protease